MIGHGRTARRALFRAEGFDGACEDLAVSRTLEGVSASLSTGSRNFGIFGR